MAQRAEIVSINARPEPIQIELGKTAVLVVDMQNDFGATGGMFDRAGIDISPIQQVVAPIGTVVAAARRVGMKVIYLKMEHRPDLSDAGAPDSPHWRKHRPMAVGEPVISPEGAESRILIRDTWNTAIVSELTPIDGDIVVSKHRYSGFYQTDLDAILKTLGVKYLMVTGCTTSVCVESTIRDAMFRDYSCVLLADCAAEPVGLDLPRSNHEASLLVIQTLFGWVATSADLTAALSP
jgi:ureidoacrylate peracid hydrolase